MFEASLDWREVSLRFPQIFLTLLEMFFCLFVRLLLSCISSINVMWDMFRSIVLIWFSASVKTRPIFVKFAREDTAEVINRDLPKGKNKTRSGTYFKCTKQFTKALQDRRNEAMLKMRELLDVKSITKGFVQYPAKLMLANTDTQNIVSISTCLILIYFI